MNIKEIREIFPIVNKSLYFDAASLSPYCIPVLDVLRQFEDERRDLAALCYDKWYKDIGECRQLAAELVNATKKEVAFTKNTSEGVNLTAQLIEWRKGDEVLLCGCDFPTNTYPFLNLKEKGVESRFLPSKDEKVPLDEIEGAIGTKTKLLSISHVFYNSGYRMDLEEIGKMCSEKDVLLHVDAAQSLGAFKIDVRKAGIDFLSAPGYKWLLSPLGTGLFYVNKKHIVKAPVVGWLSVEDSGALDPKDYKLLDSAKRFEAGNLNIGGFLGMYQALKLIDSLGHDWIERRILDLSLTLAESLERAGMEILSDTDEKHRSGIISVKKGKITKEALKQGGVVATVRKNLRLSPNIYNNEAEIERLVGILSVG